ncbi:Cell morphogenesis protein PAG1, partial [Coemansia aciculifera]
MQAVVRATQLLRAVDERFSETLVGGIFSLDARSSMSFAQPGDPLVDGPGGWWLSYSQQQQQHLHQQYCARRFMHVANLSSASTASNHNSDIAGRGGDLEGRNDESYVRHAYSASAGQVNDLYDSDADSGSSSAMAKAAAALDVKARMERSAASSHSQSGLSADAGARELNGGYLHAYLDLMHYLAASLCEYQAEEDIATATVAASTSALGDQDGGVAVAGSAAGSLSSGLADGQSSPAGDVDENGGGSSSATAAAAVDVRAVGGRSLGDWVKLVNAIEANAVALLCSSSVRVRHLAVDVLYQAGMLRRILGASEPLPLLGQTWAFRGVDSAYEILNVMVSASKSAIGEHWDDDPFEAVEPLGTQAQTQQLPLARLAASSADVTLWLAYLPQFVGRASVLMPDVMLVARTLVCQRLYQMQPLMSQYAEVSVRAGGLQHGTMYVRASGVARAHAAGSSSLSSMILRADLISAFNSLFLFAVVSLPAGGGSTAGLVSGAGGSLSDAFYGETVVGSKSPRSGVGSNSGAFSNSRLAKSIARKLAPLKGSSRGSKQEHGVGLASLSQLVRMAGVLLRSDNAALRQSVALALCHTPAAYLVELMQELRPLAESLFDDGSSLASHRNYLHVAPGSNFGLNVAAGGRDGQFLGQSNHELLPSSSGNSPRPLAAQNVSRTGSSLLAAAQIAPHGSSSSSKRRSNRAAAAAAAASSSKAAGPGSDTEATSDSGNNNSSGGGVQGRRASSFDASAMSGVTSVAGMRRPPDGFYSSSTTVSGVAANSAAATAAANAAAIAAVSGGSGSTSQMRRKRLRLSLAQIYRQVSRQLDVDDSDEAVLGQLIAYVRETKTFLSETSVQGEAEHQALRIHFCGLVEAMYYFISTRQQQQQQQQQQQLKRKEPANSVRQKFTVETRNGLYQLFERWCGLGKQKPATEGSEHQPQQLELAALRGMAVLCRDAVHFYAMAGVVAAESGGPRDKAALFAWVADALDHHDVRVQRVGQRAVEWAVAAASGSGGDSKEADPIPRDMAMMRVLIQMAYGMSVANSVINGFSGSGSGPGFGRLQLSDHGRT